MRKLLTILSVLISLVAASQPSNDLCSGATSTVANGTCYSGTTVNANDNVGGEVGCATQGGPNNHRDVWYSFTATTTTVEFNITSSSTATIELLLISGSCGSPVLENSTCMTSPLVTSFAGLTIGQTYYYVVSYPNNTQASFTTCVNSISAPPQAGQDCTSALPICSNSSFGGNSDGFGTQDLTSANRGCLSSNERQSSWYYFQIATGGTLEMTIDPSNNVDYDFAMWGPLSSYTCPVSGSPVRCSYSSSGATFSATGSYNTGIGPLGTEVSENSLGNGWVSTMNVLAGEFYILVIDNFTVDNTPFNLSWGGSAVLSCALLLPVELVSFEGNSRGNYNELKWTTASEQLNDFFTLERTTDGENFTEIALINGAGNSNEMRSYCFKDYFYEKKTMNYYRLKQTDTNGNFEYFDIIAVDNSKERLMVYQRYFDLCGREYYEIPNQPGIYLITTEYDDGSSDTVKICRK